MLASPVVDEAVGISVAVPLAAPPVDPSSPVPVPFVAGSALVGTGVSVRDVGSSVGFCPSVVVELVGTLVAVGLAVEVGTAVGDGVAVPVVAVGTGVNVAVAVSVAVAVGVVSASVTVIEPQLAVSVAPVSSVTRTRGL
jgi:hypothetical protein